MKKLNYLLGTGCTLVTMLLMTSAWAQVQFPKSLNLKYDFELASIPLGEVEKRLSYNNGVYTADSKIKPNAAAALLYPGEINEQSVFKIEDNKLISLSFHAVRKSSKPYDRKAVFDQHSKIVTYNSGESEQLRNDTYDLGSFPFAFILEDLNLIENKVYQINTGDKYRAYVVLKPQHEQVKTSAGEFNTTKITLKRRDKNNRFYHVWLDNESQYPVKIVRDKKGKISTLVLKSATS